MRETCFRGVCILYLFVWFSSDVGNTSKTNTYKKKFIEAIFENPTRKCYPLLDCGENEVYRQGLAVPSSLCGLIWKYQNQEQNVFKRFLFHYSKAQNSVNTVERESHSVHPLMRLLPKYTMRKKKQQILSI